ncbi:tail protein with lysin activity [Bacillus phage TsarBomba]|uniref:Tail lysin 1 n=1 Tax=Bacillus phage TsarBomba TaxID=1690456 RepID=A0A0K2CZX6_9CAUD|nr:tail protein with lysin activity [Bacillus phage TsarBomba]ALA13023.1 tail lysin 1 [Bacillus phage TsarBomba]
MTTIVKRYPTFEIELITQNTPYLLKYDTQKQISQKSFEEALLSFSVKNSMSDDSPAFSFVISAKEKWDKIINANDLVRIRVFPDVTKGAPDNPYIMVGLVSDIKKEGEYANGSLLYRVTGQAMTKALINFDVGVIQEVSTVIASTGWLPDDPQKGLKFSQNTAAGIGNELMERFVYKYAQYDFNGKGLKDYFVHSFSSWKEDEALADVTPFINYQGSLRQFLDDVVAKPFNELFFEFQKDGKCAALMRPTPFDPDKWFALPTYRFTSDVVVQESFGKNDNEMFSIFVVGAPNLLDYNSVDLGVFPKYHPELIKKYGYKRLDAQNRYLLSNSGTIGQGGTNAATPGAGNGTPPSGNGTGGMPTPTPATQPAPTVKEEPTKPQAPQQPSYEDVLTFITENNLQDPETLRRKRNDVYAQIVGQFSTMPASMVNGIIDALKDGKFGREVYAQLVTSAGSGAGGGATKEKSVDSEKLGKYTQKLFNWYCENANFYSGDIRILGNPAYRLGVRLLYDDFEQQTTWEFYLESVQHEFSFTGGYTTVLGVTRGLPNEGAKRFSNLWGKSEEFKGGYLGEDSLEKLLENAKNANPSGGAGGGTGSGMWGGGAGGNVAMKALATAREMTSKPSIYVFGGGRSGNNPFMSSPIRIDCSSFVWWCYNVHGVQLKGGATGMTTDTIKTDPRLQQISARGSNKSIAMSQIREGDIIYFDTYKQDGHVGIYSGNGKFIGSQSTPGIHEEDLSTSYWQKVFNGHVRRYVEGVGNIMV